MKAILEQERSVHSEVGVYLVPVLEISELHDKFFNDPTPTDCISFPVDEEYLGEVFVCPQVAIDYAKKRKLNPYEELSLYVIHGLLHCFGYDDIEPADRRVMRKKEKSCMAIIKEQDLILTP